MYNRLLPLAELLQHRSLFLLGPRQTGKSTFLRGAVPGAKFVDLLEADTFREISARPELLRQQLTASDRVIVIDEVQKLPSLLDEAQSMMGHHPKLRFVFTGSSARKLKRGHANLLAGRARTTRLHPLVSAEAPNVPLARRLSFGGLPSVIDSPEPYEDLRAYVGTYLQEEIRGEGLTRGIEPFSRFLQVAGLANGELLNFASVGNDAQVPARTVREFFTLLEDTLVGHVLPPFQGTSKRKPVATSKFYWFDVGMANALVGRREVSLGTPEGGRALEHLIFLELKAYLEYRRRDDPLTFWRTQNRDEVDFVIGAHTAIEVKATGRVGPGDLRGLHVLAEEVKLKSRFLVCSESHERRIEKGLTVLPIGEFMKRLWADELF